MPLDYFWVIPSLILATVGMVYLYRRSKKNNTSESRSAGFDPDLLSKFRATIPDVNVRERLMNNERKRSPNKTESELIKDVLDSLYRDRRSTK